MSWLVNVTWPPTAICTVFGLTLLAMIVTVATEARGEGFGLGMEIGDGALLLPPQAEHITNTPTTQPFNKTRGMLHLPHCPGGRKSIARNRG